MCRLSSGTDPIIAHEAAYDKSGREPPVTGPAHDVRVLPLG
jgi:hypothetical protein